MTELPTGICFFNSLHAAVNIPTVVFLSLLEETPVSDISNYIMADGKDGLMVDFKHQAFYTTHPLTLEVKQGLLSIAKTGNQPAVSIGRLLDLAIIEEEVTYKIADW